MLCNFFYRDAENVLCKTLIKTAVYIIKTLNEDNKAKSYLKKEPPYQRQERRRNVKYGLFMYFDLYILTCQARSRIKALSCNTLC